MSIYLAYGIVVSGLAVLVLIWRPEMRRIALISGLAAAPTGLLDALFVQDYWMPPHLLGHWFSIEGVLFSFGNGVFLWMIAAYPHRNGLTADLDQRYLASVLLVSAAASLAVIYGLWDRAPGLALLPLMHSVLVALLLLGLLIFLRAPRLMALSLSGGIGFLIFFSFQLAVLAWLDPAYPFFWHEDVRAGLTFAGYPVEELAWAAVYGTVWTAVIGYGCKVRLARGAKPGPVG